VSPWNIVRGNRVNHVLIYGLKHDHQVSTSARIAENNWPPRRTAEIRVTGILKNFLHLIFSNIVFGAVHHVAIWVVIQVPNDGVIEHRRILIRMLYYNTNSVAENQWRAASLDALG
jgi:hypothetical protein